MEVEAVISEVRRVLKGKDEIVKYSLVCLLSGGHLLLEDVPGVGKTTLTLSIAKVLGLSFARIQFTSDLLPSDILGVSLYDQSKKSFVFKKGPIFNNLILADEINRATPKTQSALLEAMAEGKVSVDGITYELPQPFFVIATQNPVEQHGTYPLPESQLDRFSMRLSLGYPDMETEAQILRGENPLERVERLKTMIKTNELISFMENIRNCYVSPEVAYLAVEIAYNTRHHPNILLGVSTRGLIHLINCAKALAYTKDRDFVVPEDIFELAPFCLSHRIVTRDGQQADQIIRSIVESLKARFKP
ncbi:MoxR family ATPase [Hydrogenobacter sp. T-2]|uniref:AAA family ATPase n=1 Tax=Pampinifervens diazotrophicum TaxID=1632018 RepID=UPI002B260A67|nr:MoxR family ATPase [Hydrogenobacter sp. T-2]WPM32171.1 MoxR family ATPase [Hydrogenobacter sp. T-2]